MREADRIADQLRRALEGDAWHGPSLAELLMDLRADHAGARPIADAHSIWGLTRHLTSWTAMARRRLKAGAHIEMPEEENFPAPSEDWAADRAALFAETRALADDAAQLTEAELNKFRYRLLHGSVQHHLYHAGQIALLRKLL